jgi:hypothetical protein
MIKKIKHLLLKLFAVSLVLYLFTSVAQATDTTTRNVFKQSALQTSIPGDVNGDGKVDIFDALLTLQYSLNLISHSPVVDANYLATADVAPLDANGKAKGDGKIDIFDALLILQASVNLINLSPSTELLTISLQGADAGIVKGIEVTISLPAGVVLRSDATGVPLAGVVATAGSASNGGLFGAKYNPATATAPGTLHLGFITTGTLTAGDVFTFTGDLALGSTAPTASAFTISSSMLSDFDGKSVTGASLALR